MIIFRCKLMKKISIIITAILISVSSALAQNVSDLIISEVMAEPDSTSLVDDFGIKTGWIEIFNTSQGTVNYGGCYLSDDPNNLAKSLIPKGDLRTKLGPRQVVVFYAGESGNKGTYYTNFELKKGSTIYLVSNDGKTIIDTIEIPSDLPAGQSVCKFANDKREMIWETASQSQVPSPMVVNGSEETQSNSDKMAETDPHGLILTLVSVMVVFSSLAILWLLFASLFQPKAKKNKTEKKAKGEMTPEIAAAISMALNQEFSDETYAAISTALHLYLADSIHDNESFIITINRNNNSNWNDKTQTFRRLPK